MKSKSKKVAFVGMLVALAFVLSYVEVLIPINLGVPGVKIGLANLVVMVALYTLSARDAFLLSMIRILLVAFTFGSFNTMMYSLAGAILSFVVMLAFKKLDILSMTGVSVLGGISHNIGQIIVAVIIVENEKLFYYLPVLLVSGIVAGIGVGVVAGLVTKRVKKVYVSEG